MVMIRKLARPKLVPKLGTAHAEVFAGLTIEEFDAFFFGDPFRLGRTVCFRGEPRRVRRLVVTMVFFCS